MGQMVLYDPKERITNKLDIAARALVLNLLRVPGIGAPSCVDEVRKMLCASRMVVTTLIKATTMSIRRKNGFQLSTWVVTSFTIMETR
jgi:hypothetical protein